MAGTFDLKKAKNGEFMFNLKAGNGETILTSETYKAKDGALNGVESVRKNSTDDKRYEKRGETNKLYFVLKAANHEIIGKSETYSSESARDNGIASVKSNAPTATVKDNTGT